MSDLFPELRGASFAGEDDATSDDASPPGTTPEIVKLKLGAPGKAIRGGAWSLHKWRQLLGMDKMRADVRRLSLDQAEVFLADGHIALTFTGDRIGQVVVHLLPCRREDSERFGVATGLQGDVPSNAVRRLLVYAQTALQDASYDTLVKLFRLDPAAHVVQIEEHDEPGAGDPGNRELEEIFERSLVRTHAGASQWHVFQAELEQRRNFNHHLSGNIAVVKHEDLECCYATPPLRHDLISFINYSASHLGRERALHGETGQSRRDDARAGRGSRDPAGGASRGASPQPRKQKVQLGELTTDLVEADVIGGGSSKAEAMLDALGDLPTAPDLVILKTSCVPAVIGDDLRGVARCFEQRSGVPALFLDNLAQEDADLFSTLLERLRWDPDFCSPAEKAGRVNLVGFSKGEEMNRLVRILEAVGVVINVRLVPEICLEDIARYTGAELQVFLDSELYRQSYRQIIGNADIPSLYTVPPHGVARSRRWLAEVAGALGLADGVGAVWDHEWAPHAEQWARLTDQAAEHCLGFVLDRRGLELLLHPEKASGVPLLEAVDEMGFALEFLLHDQIPEVPSMPGPCAMFGDPAELEERLRASAASAYYSEFYFDRRLSRCGKAQFSVSDFRLGIGGALETLRHLLQICSLPFYRRYGAHLGPAFGPCRGAR